MMQSRKKFLQSIKAAKNHHCCDQPWAGIRFPLLTPAGLCRHRLVLRFSPPVVHVRSAKSQAGKENDPHVLLVQMKIDVKVIGFPRMARWRNLANCSSWSSAGGKPSTAIEPDTITSPNSVATPSIRYWASAWPILGQLIFEGRPVGAGLGAARESIAASPDRCTTSVFGCQE
jgi:hypothetical protein